MNGIEMYINPTYWNKMNREHKRNIGKVFKVKSPNWKPAIYYIGKIGRCVDAYLSPSSSKVKFIELDTIPSLAFTIEELEEII